MAKGLEVGNLDFSELLTWGPGSVHSVYLDKHLPSLGTVSFWEQNGNVLLPISQGGCESKESICEGLCSGLILPSVLREFSLGGTLGKLSGSHTVTKKDELVGSTFTWNCGIGRLTW